MYNVTTPLSHHSHILLIAPIHREELYFLYHELGMPLKKSGVINPSKLTLSPPRASFPAKPKRVCNTTRRKSGEIYAFIITGEDGHYSPYLET